MIRLLKSRRGQIRGIDFSLAMIIFVLTMTQTLLLTNIFIESSLSYQETSERQAEANSIANAIIHSSGSYLGSDWGIVPTPTLITSTWTFGLAGDQGALNSFKVGRLSSTSLSNFYLSYNDILTGSDYSRDFKLELINPVNVLITVSDDGAGTVTVQGNVTRDYELLSQVDVAIFVIEQTNFASQSNLVQTDTSGSFSVAFNPVNFATSDYFEVIAITKYSDSIQDSMRVLHTKSGGVTPSISRISIFDSQNTTFGYSVRVNITQNDVIPSNVNFLALYIGVNGETVKQNIDLPIASADNTWSSNMLIPQDGLVYFVSQEQTAGGDFVSSMVFPVALDGKNSDIVQPSTIIDANLTIVVKSIIIRGLIMDLRLTTWEQ
ncbi:MAG: hypothetical protein OEZ01_04405 [Candidatus Heimdallarchaeota archaeon]|nr:hypothetical protein [Candidatus Heimdallarchaeota archaeon]MDH5645223.1 hypothetical protein [Candidatus Heimdallarchaeota archaeon]